MMLRRSIVVALALALTSVVPAYARPPGRTSLPVVEPQVMCVVCKLPLNEAQSPQADRERAFIQGLIDRGYDVAQVKSALVGQYGPEVLATPSTHGFGLVAYIVPAVVVAAVILLAAALLRRWRRRAAPATEVAPPLSGDEIARVDAELARFKG